LEKTKMDDKRVAIIKEGFERLTAKIGRPGPFTPDEVQLILKTIALAFPSHEAALVPTKEHIDDWVSKASTAIFDDFEMEDMIDLTAAGQQAIKTRIASIIAAHAEPLVALLRESKREHMSTCEAISHRRSDDGGVTFAWPAKACTCGARAWNAMVEASLADQTKPTCINCHKVLGSTAYGFGPSTPPGAERREVGPFCGACNDLIYVHMSAGGGRNRGKG
jgi:hypothetical protein